MKCRLDFAIVALLGMVVLVLGIQEGAFGATTFSTADFEGTWYWHGLVSGDAPAEKPGWVYNAITFDSSGNATYGPITDSEAIPYTPDPKTFSISSTGVVTIPAAGVSFHGQMNQ